MSNNEYLAHYGKLGMHWGIRRYQPYPSSYTGDGRFLGKKERTPEEERRRTEKKATKQLKKIARLDKRAESYKRRAPRNEYLATMYENKALRRSLSVLPRSSYVTARALRNSSKYKLRAARMKSSIPRLQDKAARKADKFILQYSDIDINTLKLNSRQMSSAKKYVDAAIERSKRGY